jgi:hypothetical protein
MIKNNSITAAFFTTKIIMLLAVILLTLSTGFTAFFSILTGTAQCSVYGSIPSYSVPLSTASYAFSPLLSQGLTSQSYYYPSQSGSSQASSISSVIYSPENFSSGYYYPSSSGLPVSFRQQSSTQITSASQALLQGGYYIPSINNQSFPVSGVIYGASTTGFYYPTQASAFSSGSSGNYGASSTGFYYPTQASSFSSGSSGNYGASTTGFYYPTQASSFSSGSSGNYGASTTGFYYPTQASSFSSGSSGNYGASTTGFYYPAQASAFSSGSSGNYGASTTGFYYPAQASAFSSGTYGTNNSIFAPLTPFFAQPSSYSYINGELINLPTGTRTIAAVASKVLANATTGMDGWDPVAWLNAGFEVGIWEKNLPVRAQSMDSQGLLLASTPAFSVQPTGQTGSMTLLRPDVSLYEGSIDAAGGAGDYLTTVTVDAASTTAVIHRRNFTCDACHATPPGHIANPATWGNCNQCHNLSSKIHIHAYNANIAVDDCYQCHPTGSLNSVHSQQVEMWCTDCHSTLLDAPNNQMNISGQLGLPHCADCHDSQHSENLPALFVDSVGHGGLWCSNCHGPVHAEIAPPLGYNNCKLCHTTQASLPYMGPNCQKCHFSSTSPHVVTMP